MRRKMYWGIAVFIVILFTVGVFLLTQRNVDMEPDVVYEPPSPEVIQKIKDDIAERNAQGAAKPPPPGETETSGYWHGDHWHKTQLPPLQGKKLSNSPEKPDITEEEFYASFGLKPPPEGFYYRVHADNTTVLDENGKPRLFSYYEPIFNVFTRIDFAPTPEQYAHYQKLVSEQRLHMRTRMTRNTHVLPLKLRHSKHQHKVKFLILHILL